MTTQINNIEEAKCLPCEGGIDKNSSSTNLLLLSRLNDGWHLNDSGDELYREYKFKNFAKTMFFVNAVAHIADQQFHHPDIEFGYNYCKIRYSTHSVNGLTTNDFICAGLIDKL